MVIEIIGGLSSGFFLFIAKLVDFDAFHFGKDSVIFLKIIEMIFRCLCIGFEPLRFRFPFDIHLVCQVFMEIVITERRQVIFENSPSAPRNRGFGVGGMGLLMDAFLYGIFQVLTEIDFGVADFYPSVMSSVVRSGVCVDRTVNRPHSLDLGNVRH